MEKHEIRTRLVQALAELRKEGFLARANFMCCQSCAGYELTQQAVKKVQAGKDVKGCVYWHSQDESDWRRCGSLYLAYGNMDSTECGVIGLPDVEIGKIVVEKLRKYQVPHEWDGDPKRRILVKGER